MTLRKKTPYILPLAVSLMLGSCGVPKIVEKKSTVELPDSYVGEVNPSDTTLVAWRDFFEDPHLEKLIDTALAHNQELNILLQEIDMSSNEIMARKGEYLPFVGAKAAAGAEKRSEYTPLGAAERKIDIREGKENPDPMPDLTAGLFATWEIDIWNKLHNAEKEARLQYLSSIEGKHFMETNLIAEIANLYYELLALDEQKSLVKQNLDLQTQAWDMMKLQKMAARVTELPVKKFEAEIAKNQALKFKLDQKIVEAENEINYLVGQFPQHIERKTDGLSSQTLPKVSEGIPSSLLENRPDIKKAELQMAAAKLDVKVAKAKFYPSLGISASLGYQAFNPAYLIKTPQSLIYSLAGDLMAPLINKRAIEADYLNASAKQVQTVYSYEQTLINAYVEVANQLAKLKNSNNVTELTMKQVTALNDAVQISYDLFNSAHADYMEVLMTQRDAIDARLELIESEKMQFGAVINLYRSLGGGWK